MTLQPSLGTQAEKAELPDFTRARWITSGPSVVTLHGSFLVATVGGSGLPSPQRDRLVRLIAAAPELRDLVRDLLNSPEGNEYAAVIARSRDLLAWLEEIKSKL